MDETTQNDGVLSNGGTSNNPSAWRRPQLLSRQTIQNMAIERIGTSNSSAYSMIGVVQPENASDSASLGP